MKRYLFSLIIDQTRPLPVFLGTTGSVSFLRVGIISQPQWL